MTSFYEQKIRQALEDLDTQRFLLVRATAKVHNLLLTTLEKQGWNIKQEARSTQQLLSDEIGIVQLFIPATAPLGQADLQDYATQLAPPQLDKGEVLSDTD